MLSAEISWRQEPGINHAYVWFSDGTIAGYRDLDTGNDYPTSPDYAQLMEHVLADWLRTHGIRCGPESSEPSPPEPPSGRGLTAWLARRRSQREHARAVAAHREWQLDHPSWRVPVDPPHAGWRDLVRNDPGHALWHRAAQLPEPRWFDFSARRETRAWTQGARGEETVAAELWRIARPGAWRYVHSVPVGTRGSDIDHVLVGPGGVFTLNTKAHPGASIWVGEHTFMVNGRKQPYLRNSRHEAARASRLLTAATGSPIEAHSVIVLVDPGKLTIRTSPRDVTITTRRGLKRWASALPSVLPDQEVETIFNQIRRSSTWI
ncbi:nuclease-related domain-containing protein [Humibacillus xanthopallidus]|uniref:Nuclease-like protein n=1 Tax=Humibacillus xanthopallidus TaxID=412689 RepID=A0A543H8J9_9MICO|nr:nuclease-related domain-containing protein [Humibacillus xanthopallidus]TQM54593.1 nuclease-like protein [Humibacillus xanthopallidus]